MNKIKFLACAVMAAFFALGITSCEKENFAPNVDIEAPNYPEVEIPEGYQPGDAAISVTPQVFAVINGEIKNVTNDATITITYNGEAKPAVVNKAIAATTVKIVAAYDYEINGKKETFTTEYTINVPALSAGQVAVYSPTLILTINFTEEGEGDGDGEGDGEGDGDGEGEGNDSEKVSLGFITEVVEGSTVVEKSAKDFELNNTTDYYYTNVSTASTNLMYGTFISDIKVEADYKENKEVQAILGSYNQGVKDYQIKMTGITLWPNTKSCYAVEEVVETKDYIVKEQFETRATTEAKAATFTVKDYSYIVSTTAKYYNAGEGHNGTGHSHTTGSGHSHGHGHGTDNAGGGIVWGN